MIAASASSNVLADALTRYGCPRADDPAAIGVSALTFEIPRRTMNEEQVTYWYDTDDAVFLRCTRQQGGYDRVVTVHRDGSLPVEAHTDAPPPELLGPPLKRPHAVPSDRRSFEAAALRNFRHTVGVERTGPDAPLREGWTRRLLKCVHSVNLNQLQYHALQDELYEEAASIQQEIEDRVRLGYMARAQDGSAYPVTISPENAR
jgi:hypothetical protein